MVYKHSELGWLETQSNTVHDKKNFEIWQTGENATCTFLPKGYLKKCLLSPDRFAWLFKNGAQFNSYWEPITYKKLSGTEMTKIRRWSMPRGAHTHVPSLLQTLKRLSSPSETTLGHARSHESPHDSIHPSDTSLLALSNTRQAHSPATVYLLLPF